MEVSPLIKKCDICREDAKSLCIKCMLYFCDGCFKIAHESEETKSHTKEKIDYFCPIDTKCPIHPTHPMDLFCTDEKGNTNFLLIFIYK